MVTATHEPGPSQASLIALRFSGYLTGDALTYLLGFILYAWLVRILSNQQYGRLGVATSIYQVMMMVAALGIDLVGPRLLSEHPQHMRQLISSIQRLRLKVALFVCIPAMLLACAGYARRGDSDLVLVILASASMVIARAFDLSYVAVALGLPVPLAKSRILGLLLYVGLLLAARPWAVRFIWIIPLVNALAVTVGRMDLMRRLRLHLAGAPPEDDHDLTLRRDALADKPILIAGAQSGLGQLIMLGFQTLDVVLLNHYCDVAQVGQYAMISRLYLLGTAVLTSIFSAFLPQMLHNLAFGTAHAFGRRHRTFLAASALIGLIGTLAIYFIGGPAAEMIAGRPLPVARQVVPVFALSYFLLSLANPFSSLLPSLRRETAYLAGIAVAAITVLVMDMFLVPRYLWMGAAVGQAVGTAVLLIFSGIVFFKSQQARAAVVPA